MQKKYFLKEAEIAIENCGELELKTGNQKQDLRIGRGRKAPFLEFLVDFRKIDDHNKMELTLKINRPKNDHERDYRKWLEEKGVNSKAPELWINGPKEHQRNYCHLAWKEYKLNGDDLEKLSHVIAEGFEKFKPIFEEIESLLEVKRVMEVSATGL